MADQLETRPSPTIVAIPNSVAPGAIKEIRRKNLTIRAQPFKVIGTDTDRSAIYDFQLVIHSNHMGLCRTLSVINSK